MKVASMRGMKLGNEYAALLGRFYAATPKSVFAALAVSYAVRNGAQLSTNDVETALRDEWGTLHQNGIVQQAPPKRGL